MNALLAIAPIASWGLVEWAVAVIIIAGVVIIAIKVLNYMGITIPAIFWQIFWIVVLVVIAVLAIKFLSTLL